MHTRLFIRYVPQAGSARRYYDRESGRTISRRAFLILRGIHPEYRALSRRAAGIPPRRKRRSDAGTSRSLLWNEARIVAYPGKLVQLVPYPQRSARLLVRPYVLIIDHVPVLRVYHLPGRNKHHGVWQCGCRLVTVRNKEALAAHVVMHHFSAVCASRGVGPSTVRAVGYHLSHATRVRMPWRVEAPEYR